jgi:hypothetical protein
MLSPRRQLQPLEQQRPVIIEVKPVLTETTNAQNTYAKEGTAKDFSNPFRIPKSGVGEYSKQERFIDPAVEYHGHAAQLSYQKEIARTSDLGSRLDDILHRRTTTAMAVKSPIRTALHVRGANGSPMLSHTDTRETEKSLGEPMNPPPLGKGKSFMFPKNNAALKRSALYAPPAPELNGAGGDEKGGLEPQQRERGRYLRYGQYNDSKEDKENMRSGRYVEDKRAWSHDSVNLSRVEGEKKVAWWHELLKLLGCVVRS